MRRQRAHTPSPGAAGEAFGRDDGNRPLHQPLRLLQQRRRMRAGVRIVPHHPSPRMSADAYGVSMAFHPRLLVLGGVPSVQQAARDEMASLVPAKVGVRTVSTADSRSIQSARVSITREPSLPVDEDQFDIPTFLRRQGVNEMP